MSLVNIETVHRQTLRLLAKMSSPSGVELLSFKRNRHVSLELVSDHLVRVRERGYIEQDLTISMENLSRALKVIIKREFPRSRKVRIVKFSHSDELERMRNTL